MDHSESLALFAPDFNRFQGEARGVEKNATARFGGYADIEACVRTNAPLLAKYGFSVFQSGAVGPNGENMVETMVLHTSGQWIRGSVLMPPSSGAIAKDACQAHASAMTYGRRVGYMAALGAYPTNAATDPARDADGEVADGINAEPRKPKGYKKPTARGKAGTVKPPSPSTDDPFADIGQPGPRG